MREAHHVRIEGEALDGSRVEVARLTGSEAISRLYELDLLLVCRDNDGLDIEALVGSRVAVIFERGGEELRTIYGVIASARDRMEVESAHATYAITVAPRAHLLTLVETCDAYLDMSLPEVIRMKLGEIGLTEPNDVELRLYETYERRDFIVQYKETDLAFLSRLSEHVGMSFFFEQRDGRDVIVFTDAQGGFPITPGGAEIAFRSRGERRDLFELEEAVKMIPGSYLVQDYNYRTPQVALTGRADVPAGVGGVVEYGAHVKTPEEASKLARIRAQERVASRRVFHGKSDVARLGAGMIARIEGHPRGDVELTIVEVRHRYESPTLLGGSGQGGYDNELRAIPSSRTYRPPRVTPKPRVHGVVTGVIDAESEGAEYAEVDDQGRYRVRFLFDTTGPDKGKGSRPIRMAQPHAGPGYGMHFPLRPGIEVIITFVDGDPDRPIIAATVPNPLTASPVTSGNAPRNVIRTGSGNEINIDDSKDNQRIKISTPHKNTTFQLGSPNSPENGAMLETWGSSSTSALSGTAAFTSFNASLNAIKSFKKGGSITTIAEKPDAFATVSGVAEIIGAAVEAAKAGADAVAAGWDAHLNGLKKDSIDAQVKAKNQWNATITARANARTKDAALRAKLNAIINDPTKTQAEKTAAQARIAELDAYEAALKEYEAAQLSLRTNEEFLRDAKKGNASGTYTAEVKSYEQAVATDQARLTAALTALNAARTNVANAPKYAAPADLKTAQSDYGTAVTAEQTADTESERLWGDARTKKKKYDDAVADRELGTDGQNLKATQNTLATISAAKALFCQAMQLYAIIKELKEKVEEMEQKLEAELASLDSTARKVPTIFAPRVDALFPVRHTLGSKSDMLVYGENNCFIWGGSATIYGKDSMAVIGKDSLHLLSKKHAEIAAKRDLFLTAKKVNVRAGDEIKLHAEPRAVSQGTGTITAIAKSDITITSNEGDILADAPYAGSKIDLSAEKTVVATAGAAAPGQAKIELDKAKKATLSAGTWALEIDGAMNEVTLKDPALPWSLEVKDSEASLGSDDVHVKMNAGGVMVRDRSAAGAEVLVGAGEVSVEAGKLTLKATTNNMVVQGNKILLG